VSEENRKTMMAFYEAFNRHDTGRLRDLMAEDLVDHERGMSPGPGSSREDAIAWIEGLWAGIPDLHMDVRDILADGDRVAARVVMTGTHTGELMGLPPTGRPLSVETIDIVRLRDGRAAEHWGVTDTAAMLTQLGLAPAEGVIETVTAIYDALGRQDVPAILDLVADDVVWEQDGIDHGVPWLRPGRGRDAAAAFFQTIGDRLDITRLEIRNLLASGNQVAAVVDIDARDRESGQDLSDRSEVHLWTIEDGRATAFRHHVDTHAHWLAARG
jgi:steroid delta-isomerase-like uncharacterized protein